MLTALCSSCGCSRRSAFWLLGISIVLVAVAIVIQVALGPSIYAQGLLYAAYPMALLVAGTGTTRPWRGWQLVLALLVVYCGFVALAQITEML